MVYLPSLSGLRASPTTLISTLVTSTWAATVTVLVNRWTVVQSGVSAVPSFTWSWTVTVCA